MRKLLLALVFLSAGVCSTAKSKKKAARSKRRAASAPGGAALPQATSTQQADALIADVLQASEGGQQGDPYARFDAYAATLGRASALASLEQKLRLLDAAAKLARKLKQHERALSYHREMLTLKGQAGAIPESYLVLWTEIATDLQLASRHADALHALAQADEQLRQALAPEALALLYKQRAFLLDCSGRYAEAGAQMESARALAEAEHPVHHLDEVVRHRLILQRQLRAHERDLGGGGGGGGDRISEAQLPQLEAQVSELGRYLLQKGPWTNALQLPHHYVPDITASPWHDAPRRCFAGQLAPLLDLLEEAAPALRKEYRRLKRKGLLTADEDCIQHPSSGSLAPQGEGGAPAPRPKWRRYETAAVWQQLNGTTCSVDTPAACEVILHLRLTGAAPILRAGYSAVDPNTWIRPHFGGSNAQLKLHLGLLGCNDCATMRVGTEWRPWAEGRVSLFDDSFEHEVVNDCAAERVVFQVIIRHPDLQWEDARSYAPVVQDAH